MRQRILILLITGVSFVAAYFAFRLLRPSSDGAENALPDVAGLESPSGPASTPKSGGALVAPERGSQLRDGAASQLPVELEGQRSVQAVSRSFKELSDCRTQHRCPTGTECARTAAGALGCYASNCKGPDDFASCSQDEACVEVSPAFFRCAPAGFLVEGDECVDRQAANVARRCGAGLQCMAGRCSSPCQASKRCASANMRCLETKAGAYCVPAESLCDASHRCPDGKACLDDERAGTSVCISASLLPSGQEGCVPGSCPQGQVCAGSRWGSRFHGRCLVDCSQLECSQNTYCAPADLQKLTGPMVYHPTCKPPGTECGEDGQCVFNPTKGIGLCATTMPYDDTTNSLDEWDAVFPPTPDAIPTPP